MLIYIEKSCLGEKRGDKGTMLTELQVKNFIDVLSKEDEPPAAGSASALTALIGAGLLSMVINTNIKSFSDFHLFVNGKEEIENIKKSFISLIDKDAKVLEEILEELELNQDLDEDAWQEKARTSFIAAAKVPLEIGQTCFEALKLAREIAPYVKKSTTSELVIGVINLQAAIDSVNDIVLTNTSSLKEDFEVADLKQEAILLKEVAMKIREKIEETVRINKIVRFKR